MAWSYRQDRIDEVYGNEAGVTVVAGKTIPETPANPEEAEEMTKPAPKGKAKEGVLTEFQEFPGQNVPRVIEGEGETARDKKIVEAAKANDNDKKLDATRAEMLSRERARITMEEQMKSDADELEKEREKIRKEVQQELKKNDKKEHVAASPR